jgi:hypothetical protein
MPLEPATYITDLNSANTAATAATLSAPMLSENAPRCYAENAPTPASHFRAALRACKTFEDFYHLNSLIAKGWSPAAITAWADAWLRGPISKKATPLSYRETLRFAGRPGFEYLQEHYDGDEARMGPYNIPVPASVYRRAFLNRFFDLEYLYVDEEDIWEWVATIERWKVTEFALGKGKWNSAKRGTVAWWKTMRSWHPCPRPKQRVSGKQTMRQA